ncbi:MAG: STAS domain-containing protein [Acidobacteria bacterium]|nr:STAS domain-containing protein [Acidobacteriota bacterium]
MPSITRHVSRLLLQPFYLARDYDRRHLKPDLVAGLTVAVVMIPQGIAFALIAELPPEMGLYTAIVGALVAGLWGHSHHQHTGPANAMSLLVLSTLLVVSQTGTQQFIVAAGLLAVMAGLVQLLMGLARLGLLVNFVSHSVVVGFSAGAGVLIIGKQLRHLLGIDFQGDGIITTARSFFDGLGAPHWPTLLLGLGTMVLMAAVRRWRPVWPSLLMGMIGSALAVYLLRLDQQGVSVLGALPFGLPPVAGLPVLNVQLMSQLVTGALAVAAIGLVETSAISRSIAAQSGQHLDSNQEFVGQGLANIGAGVFSGFPLAASFSRSAINYRAGARTTVASIFSGIFVLLATLLLAPYTALLPRTALAAVLIITAFAVIDFREMRRILRGTRGDALIMVVTFGGTVMFQIDFAVLTGILLSFAVYILRTSAPRVYPVVSDLNFRHFIPQEARPACPQLGIMNILGDLYFGAVNHIEQAITKYQAEHPTQRFLLLRMRAVNQCDFSGIHMLESVCRTYREMGGDVYLVHVRDHVLEFMKSTRFYEELGADHFLAGDTAALDHLFYRIIDPAVCIYECPVRVWKECQNLPKEEFAKTIPSFHHLTVQPTPTVTPRELWELQHAEPPRPLIIDVREPREYRREHIAGAELRSLSGLDENCGDLLLHRSIVLVCRTGRRSHLAAAYLQHRGFSRVSILRGGLRAWKAEGLLTAVLTGDNR